MKHLSKVMLLGVLGLLLVAGYQNCGQSKDFTGAALGSHLTVPLSSQCKTQVQAFAAKVADAPDEFANPFRKAGRKVMVSEGSSGAAIGSSLQKNVDTELSQGTEIAIELEPHCLVVWKQGGNSDELTEDFQYDPSLLTPGLLEAEKYTLKRNWLMSELEAASNSNPCISGVAKFNYYKRLMTYDDPDFSGRQKYLTAINAPAAHDIFYDATKGIKSEVIIAVIDDGVDISHNDFLRPGGNSQLWVNEDEVAGNATDDDGNGFVDDRLGYNFVRNVGSPSPAAGSIHGTHVAGLVAAAGNNGRGVVGTMPQYAKIMGLNVFDDQESIGNSNIARAIRYAAANGANVINMSLGGTQDSTDPIIESAINEALAAGVTIVVAAGNFKWDASTFTPARYGIKNGLISVAALDANFKSVTGGTIHCSFTNWSPTAVEIGAPGCDLTSGSGAGLYNLKPGNQYQSIAGTSMASPIVAGAAAQVFGLIRQRTGTAPSPAVVERILLESAISDSRLQSVTFTNVDNPFTYPTPVESDTLTGKQVVRQNKVLDLLKAAQQADSEFPPGTTITTTTQRPDPCAN